MKILCDRQDFIDCVNGELLHNEKGTIKKLGDRASDAVEAADRGEPVFLTRNGEIITVMVDHQEVLYEDYKKGVM